MFENKLEYTKQNVFTGPSVFVVNYTLVQK